MRRDRNHPSIWMWEPILNEIWYPEDFARNVVDIINEECSYCYSVWNGSDDLYCTYHCLHSRPKMLRYIAIEMTHVLRIAKVANSIFNEVIGKMRKVSKNLVDNFSFLFKIENKLKFVLAHGWRKQVISLYLAIKLRNMNKLYILLWTSEFLCHYWWLLKTSRKTWDR